MQKSLLYFGVRIKSDLVFEKSGTFSVASSLISGKSCLVFEKSSLVLKKSDLFF